MRKVLTLLTVIAISFALVISPAIAGNKCCPSGKKAGCAISAKACAEIHKGDAKDTEKKHECASLVLAIEGMTCGGCETHISTALGKLDGVFAVESISHKDGKAVVCINPSTKSDDIAKYVTDLGYKVKSSEVSKAKICSHDKEKCAHTAKVEVKADSK